MDGFEVHKNQISQQLLEKADLILDATLDRAGGPPTSIEDARDHWVPAKTVAERHQDVLALWNKCSFRQENKLPRATKCQIAFRFPGERCGEGNEPPPDWFLREVHVDNPQSTTFMLLVGVVLSDHQDTLMGNFTVFPGLHLKTRDFVKTHPLTKHNMQPLMTFLGLNEQTPRQQLRCERGDLLVVHRWLPHTVAPNCSTKTRRIVWFRLYQSR